MHIAADCIGYFAVFLGLFSYVSTKRKPIYIMKGVTDALWVINLAMYGMYTAAFINCMNIGRTTVSYFREDKKWAAHRIWLPIFLAATLISPILTWAGSISLLPSIGSLLACFGYYMHSPLALKCFVLPGTALWLVYGILSGNISLIVGNVLNVTSLSIGIVREIVALKKTHAKSEP
ncbi:MAG: YgjV family protein [Clostridia bacterium]|nr:YgjV family protein [Clostridia bacterium]